MWNAERGFGFIADDLGGPDMFLNVSVLQSVVIDPDNMKKGERLTFDDENSRDGKTRASNGSWAVLKGKTHDHSDRGRVPRKGRAEDD
jgi:cold shock CspA family protein